jgi:MFS family permease
VPEDRLAFADQRRAETVSATAALQGPIRSTIPARLDRLGWSPFHTRMVAGLGAAWILDGLQITIASSVTGVLSSPDTLGMTSTEIGLIASVYLVGQIIGALVFGRLSDQLGRRRLLMVTLLLYLLGTGAAAFTTGHHTGWLVFFYATRLVAGMGIGGQYAAINSAIDEMMPSKYRDGSTSGSTAATGPGRSSAPSPPWCSSTPSHPTSAGGWPS